MNVANRTDMNAVRRFEPVTQALANYWLARKPRERNVIALGLAAIALALLYLLLIEPALAGREQLRKSLPTLRQQVTQMQSMAREIRADSATSATGAADVPPVTREGLEAALASAGLKVESVSVTGEFIRLQINGVSFAALVGWLDQAGKTLGISVVETRIVAQNQLDMVNGTLTLRQQRRE